MSSHATEKLRLNTNGADATHVRELKAEELGDVSGGRGRYQLHLGEAQQLLTK